MPVDVYLFFPASTDVLDTVRLCPALQEIAPFGKPLHNGYFKDLPETNASVYCSTDVYTIALIKDIYGRANAIATEDQAYLQQFKHEQVFLPSSIYRQEKQKKYVRNALGTLNVPFLSWIKSMARQYQTSLLITYEHERGDFPYETAYWKFNYIPTATVCESFGLYDHDGNTVSAEIYRLHSGKIIYNVQR